MTLDQDDIDYLLRLVRAERTEAHRHYDAARSEMLARDRAHEEAERTLAPPQIRREKKMQLVWATNTAENARARLRRAEGLLKKLEEL